MESGMPSAAKRRRLGAMLHNAAAFSDVEFRVGPGPKVFLALRALYARASDVFSKMFFETGLREQSASGRVTVDIPDISPDAFEQLHRWVYDADVAFTPDNAFGVLDAAMKYMMEDLETCCRQWIVRQARTADGVLALIAAAARGAWNAWARSLAVRAQSLGADALASPKMASLPFDMFSMLLQESAAPMDDVFMVAESWANAAEQRGEAVDAAWQRIIESGFVMFHLMDQRAFAERVVVPGRISDAEVRKVFVHMGLGGGPARRNSALSEARLIWHGVADLTIPERGERFAASLACLAASSTEIGRDFVAAFWEAVFRDSKHDLFWDPICKFMATEVETSSLTCTYFLEVLRNKPGPESLVGVWNCPVETLQFARQFAHLPSLYLVALMEALEDFVQCAEAGTYSHCKPIAAAKAVADALRGQALQIPQTGWADRRVRLWGLLVRFDEAFGSSCAGQ